MSKNKSIVKMLKPGKIKQERKIKDQLIQPEDDVSRAIKIFAIVIVLLVLVYFISGLVTGEIKIGNKIKPATIQYEEILIGTAFNQNPTDYYIIMYNYKTDTNAEQYKSYINNYKSKENAIRVYYVNLNVGLNNKYISDNVNYNPSKSSEIRVNDVTIMKISNSQLSMFITGTEQVVEYLNSL